MDPVVISQKIKQLALSLGFQKVGIVPAVTLEDESAHLWEWLDRGYHAEMAWMFNHFDKRANPSLLLENPNAACSIVCVGMNYYTPDTAGSAGTVKIAKYAKGTDYHVVLKDRLKQLLVNIQQEYPEVSGRAFTDSAPIMEKPLAVRAGIGWQGKNANILTSDYGSWLFLGELLLNVPLAYDSPYGENRCGTCTRCIDACPTQAITEPAVVDANRCLSYWTIEYKGEEIPEAIAQKMDGWVFGCDICQDVCPWNIKFAQATREPDFQPRPWNNAPTAQELTALTPEQFQERYRKSPLKRAKLKGLKRNVQAAMKYRKD